MACGLCLLVGPAMILVASIVDPAAGEGEGRDSLQALRDDPDMAQLATALQIWGFVLVALGLVGVVHVIRRRGVVLANVGGTLAVVGLIMLAALTTTNIEDLNVAEHLNLDTAVALDDDIEDYWVAYVVFVPALLGTVLGFILLAAAIIRSGVAHVAAAVLVLAGVVALAASEESKALAIAANVLLLLGWGLVGLKLLGMTDEQWEDRAA
jgi:FtsH-binding integral membrane protein